MTINESSDLQPICDHIRRSLTMLVERIRSFDPDLICSIASSSNPAYLFRAYAAFLRNSGGEELAVTVNVKIAECKVLLAADLCTEHGEVLADGPSESFQLPSSGPVNVSIFSGWTDSFDDFLVRIESVILAWQKKSSK